MREFEIKVFAERHVYNSKHRYPIKGKSELMISVEETEQLEGLPERVVAIHDVFFKVATNILDDEYWQYSHYVTRNNNLTIVT